MLKDLSLLVSLAASLATTMTSDDCNSQSHSRHMSVARAVPDEDLKGNGECLKSSRSCGCEMLDGHHYKKSMEESQMKLQMGILSTSVWCQITSESGIRCHFQNLFYNAKYKEFVFVLGSESIVNGIENLKRLEELYLSSVDGHNAFQIRLSVIPWKAAFTAIGVSVIRGNTLMMGRFKPDNILHVFHDDLIPLYFTIRELCHDVNSCRESLNVVFTDENRLGEFWDLYGMFSSKVWKLSDFTPEEVEWYCFQGAYVGLNKMSVWYQYGFGIPQGPVVNKMFQGTHLRQFANFVRDKLNVRLTGKVQRSVLLSRKSNRKIINEKELSLALQSLLISHKKEGEVIEMSEMSLEENDLKSIMTKLSESALVIGVHGSALILGMFLPPGSVLMEIWPYGIDPSAAKVFKTMCELGSFGVIYVPWSNDDFHNTISHPEYPQHYGGLRYLPVEEQKGILDRLQKDKLSELECCDSTEWLFRIYQDTRINIHGEVGSNSDSIIDLVSSGLEKAKSVALSESESTLENLEYDFYLGRVQFLRCFLEKQESVVKLYAEWQEPWNAGHLECVDLKYEVILQSDGEDESVRHEIKEHRFLKKLKIDIEYVYLWVTCFCDNVEGSTSFVACR